MLEIIQLLIIIGATQSAVCVTRELIKCFFCYLTLVYKHFYSTHKCCANSALTIMNQGSRNIQSTACSHRHPAWLGEAPSPPLVVLSHEWYHLWHWGLCLPTCNTALYQWLYLTIVSCLNILRSKWSNPSWVPNVFPSCEHHTCEIHGYQTSAWYLMKRRLWQVLSSLEVSLSNVRTFSTQDIPWSTQVLRSVKSNIKYMKSLQRFY